MLKGRKTKTNITVTHKLNVAYPEKICYICKEELEQLYETLL